MINFTLEYAGRDADDHKIDFYDVAHAIIGFQRSLAITTHLVLTGEIITKAPSLQNARILTAPPQEGSWKITAIIVGAVFTAGTAPKDTPIGHLIHSAYDYVISESLGFHVDYEKSLGQQYELLKKRPESTIPILEQSKMDSAIEKCEGAINDMHRPIWKSQTASTAELIYHIGPEEKKFEHPLTIETYDHIRFTRTESESHRISGRVSNYNINTYNGRIFLPEERRPIPFILADTAKSRQNIGLITNSLTMNARNRLRQEGTISCIAYRNLSRTGRLKSLIIIEVLAD